MRTGSIKKIIVRLSLGIAALPLIVATVGIVYEQANRLIVNRRFSPEGELVDVGGHQLHFLKQGVGHPSIIFESGMDPFGHLSWHKVEEGLIDIVTTVSYDRSGILWSERSESPKTLDAISNDLSNLLTRINAPKPYIIVGHSSAGITLRTFIKDNKEDIAGIVLVDASHPEQAVLRPPKVPSKILMNLMNFSGLVRITSSGRGLPNTDPEDRINRLGTSLIHRSNIGMFDEASNLVAMSSSAQEVESFDDIPLVVISATGYMNNLTTGTTEAQQMIETRQRLQSDLLDLSKDSRQVEAGSSTHYVQLEEPTIVISAIQSLIAKFHSKDHESVN